MDDFNQRHFLKYSKFQTLQTQVFHSMYTNLPMIAVCNFEQLDLEEYKFLSF